MLLVAISFPIIFLLAPLIATFLKIKIPIYWAYGTIFAFPIPLFITFIYSTAISFIMENGEGKSWYNEKIIAALYVIFLPLYIICMETWCRTSGNLCYI